MNDPVNHPPHYTAGKIEVIDLLEDVVQHYGNGCVDAALAWQVLKYVSRAPLKGFYLQDLQKAQWYLNRLVARIEERNK